MTYKIIEGEELGVELVAIKCQCGTRMKVEQKVIDRDEAFHCPYCRIIGFIEQK